MQFVNLALSFLNGGMYAFIIFQSLLKIFVFVFKKYHIGFFFYMKAHPSAKITPV